MITRWLIAVIIGMIVLPGCSSSAEPKVVVEHYYPSYRQYAPEPVYGRLTWSHLPGPIPQKKREQAPYIMPVISFELPNSSFEEALQALAQTIGYRWSYPPELGKRRISIRQVGSVEEILGEIGRQAGVFARLDHENRMVRVVDGSTAPRLPDN